MNYLITGGSGLIGSELAKRLISNYNKIYIVDKKNKKNVNKAINFKKVDILKNTYNLRKIIKKKKIQCIIHLAAFLGVKETENDPISVLNINYNGTKNILEACNNSCVKYFIFSSSSEIYGDQNKKFTENTNPSPKSFYGFAKWQAEILVKEYCETKNINYNIIRFFNIYGRNQKNQFVIPKFLNLAKKNKKISLYGNGSQIRSFCFIDDAVDGVIKIIKLRRKNSTYNIGNNKEPIKIINLAKKIIKISKSKSKIVKIPFSLSDRSKSREIFRRIPVITKAKNDLRYSPTVTLDEGIKEILKK